MKTLLIALTLITSTLRAVAAEQPEKPSFEQYLERSAVSRETIDLFLRGPDWAQFDPELGYIQRSYMGSDGIDNSTTIASFQTNGARTSFMYSGRKPRINTYGDSFTEGNQVSDGETWQEYLAGHLGEPIGNFGVGGYGVYQAYRRMLREERTGHGAEYLIFYIWGDDSTRSLFRDRHSSLFSLLNYSGSIPYFNGNFWAHLELNLETGRFVEMENLLSSPESLYHMTEPQWMADHLKDDLALQLYAYSKGLIRDLDRERTAKLAAWLDFPFDWSLQSQEGAKLNQLSKPVTPMQLQAGALLDRYSLRATRFILDKARAFARQNGKKLLVVLFDPSRVMNEMEQSGTRYDQEIVDHLVKGHFDYFDMNVVHLRDFRNYKLPWQEYKNQFFASGFGHYNPRGNHFFAYSIKDKVVGWLDLKPITYQQPDPRTVDFKAYMQGYMETPGKVP